MLTIGRIEPLILFLGDLAVFAGALWLALFLRSLKVPSPELYQMHLAPFSILFAIWILVFFIVGLYEKHTVAHRMKLPALLLRAHLANSVIAVIFFYLVPYFTITPKTVLFLTLIITFLLLVFWRLAIPSLFGLRKREHAILIGTGEEMRELFREVNDNHRYGLHFITFLDVRDLDRIDFQNEVLDRVYGEGVSTIVVDLKSEYAPPVLPHLYNLIFSNIRFIDMYRLYEDVFDRVPLSLIGYNWFLENISASRRIAYDTLKRMMDVTASLVLGVISLTFYPFIIAAIKWDDGGEIFSVQERVGQGNRLIKVYKFRTMTFNDNGKWNTIGRVNRVTRVGAVLRRTRLDELPQLWNVLAGSLSLIGPRPEFPDPVRKYEEMVPYYNMRHLVKPGLSGWAQLYHQRHPHHEVNVRETYMKLSYDLYYIKNRSFWMDVRIALKTLKVLLSQSGV